MKLLEFKVLNAGVEISLFSNSLEERYRGYSKLSMFNHLPHTYYQKQSRRKSSYYDDNMMETEISLGKR